MKDVKCNPCGGKGEIEVDTPNGGTEVKVCTACKGTGVKK